MEDKKRKSKYWTKKEENLLIDLKDEQIKPLSWSEISSYFPERSIENIKRKYYRILENKENPKPRKNKLGFSYGYDNIKNFKKDYQNLKKNVNDIMKKYNIPNKTALYKLVKEFGIKRPKTSNPQFKYEPENIENFKKDYQDLNKNLDDVMKKYDIANRSALYKVTNELNVKRKKKKNE